MMILLFDLAGSFPMLPPTVATCTVVFDGQVGLSVSPIPATYSFPALDCGISDNS